MSKLDKLFKSSDKKELKNLNKIVDEIEKLEDTISKLSDEELKYKKLINDCGAIRKMLISSCKTLKEKKAEV